MLKLVGDEVPSVEGFMSRYRVCTTLLEAKYRNADPYTRWTFLLRYIVYKWVCQLLLSTQARQAQKLGSGLQRPRRCFLIAIYRLIGLDFDC